MSLTGHGIDFDANISKVDANGGILGVSILHKGSSYTSKSNILIDDPTGAGAILKPILGGGEQYCEHLMVPFQVRLGYWLLQQNTTYRTRGMA